MTSTVIFGGGHWTCSKCKRTIYGSSIHHDCDTNLFIQNKMIQVTINEVKKNLYKSKVNAKFSHYAGGKLYYNVELSDGRIYQFPISTTEQISLIIACESDPGTIEVNGDLYTDKTTITALSADLGQTPFHAEIKASELNRWIAKAFDKGEFICINKAPDEISGS